MATLDTLATTPARTRARRPFGLLGRSGVYLVLTAGLVVTLLPFAYVLLTSLKPNGEIMRVPPTFLPETWTLANFRTIFSDPRVPLARFYANSLFVAAARVAITLFTSSFAGYIFAKYRFGGRDLAFIFILAQIMIPFQVVMVPAYLILVQLRLVDTLWGLIVPSMVDAFGIFLMRQFIESIPNELMDAARIDGASEFGIYWRIILPQLGTPLASLGIFTFMATWNDYLWPLIVITTHERRTLPLLLTWYNSEHGSSPGLSMAASVLVLLPVLVVYIFCQRWIVTSVTQTGFK